MAEEDDPVLALARAEQADIIHVESSAVGAIVKSEVEAQLDAAHRYPRSITRFLKESMTLATITRDVAESCIYTVPRDGKNISGPSIRLAELMASAYGNLHVGGRVIDEESGHVIAQGVAWDLEKNVRVSLETKRRITGKNGRRFSADMITTTGNAAVSIALRNAIFRVVPRSYVMSVYAQVRRVAIGDASTLADRRAQVLERLQKLGVSRERVLTRLEKRGVEEIGVEDLEVLIGLGTSIKDGHTEIDEAFPEPAPAPAEPAKDGQRISMKGSKKADEPKAPEPEPERQPGEEG